jgi:hypothetical protein
MKYERAANSHRNPGDDKKGSHDLKLRSHLPPVYRYPRRHIHSGPWRDGVLVLLSVADSDSSPVILMELVNLGNPNPYSVTSKGVRPSH